VYVDIVKEKKSARGQFREPVFQVMAYGLFAMQTIQVQDVDFSVGILAMASPQSFSVA